MNFFHEIYVDNMLIIIKLEHLDLVHKVINSFEKKTMIHCRHFWKIKMQPDGLAIYCKPNNTVYQLHQFFPVIL